MRWAVVKFMEENTVEVVPLLWYVNDREECFWPPLNTKKSKIANFIEKCQEPLSDWVVCHAKLLGKYGKWDIINLSKPID